jgi:hypothetical protein
VYNILTTRKETLQWNLVIGTAQVLYQIKIVQHRRELTRYTQDVTYLGGTSLLLLSFVNVNNNIKFIRN